jgi:hypothetical protein
MQEEDSPDNDQTAREPAGMQEGLGRLPVGHDYHLGLLMPKPDTANMGGFSSARVIAVFALAILIGVVLFLVLPAVLWPH